VACFSIELRAIGKAQSIGVSNYGIHHLEELFGSGATSRPAVNQIELSPYLPREELVSFCEQTGIVVEAYSPLTKAARLTDSRLVAMAAKYNVTPAQVLIQWCLQKKFVTIPKSVNPGRIAENAETLVLFPSDADQKRFLAESDLDEMKAWNEGLITGWDPVSGP
jgi:diketogulonate reductase-like aldo/keto reductase